MAGGLGRTNNDGQEQEGNEMGAEGEQDDPNRSGKKKTRVSRIIFKKGKHSSYAKLCITEKE